MFQWTSKIGYDKFNSGWTTWQLGMDNIFQTTKKVGHISQKKKKMEPEERLQLDSSHQYQ